MTGPEHYKSAERWLYKAAHADARGSNETAEYCLAIATGHMKLAGIAASLLKGCMPPDEWQAWLSAVRDVAP